MFAPRTILMPTDYSACADRAYSFAAALAEHFGAALHVLHVRLDEGAAGLYAPPLPPPCKAAIDPPVRAEVTASSAVAGILRYVREHGVDLVVMGARGRGGLKAPHLGSVSRSVVERAPCTVLTVRQPMPHSGLRHVLVPVDFSEASLASLTVAKALAAAWAGTVELLYVITRVQGRYAEGYLPTAPLPPQMARRWERTLLDFAARARGPAVPVRPHVRLGPAAPTIVNVALQVQADLVVIGAYGKGGPKEGTLGSVAERVAVYAPCATLTFRPARATTGEAAETGAVTRRARANGFRRRARA